MRSSSSLILIATFGSNFGSRSLGNVAQTGLTEDFVANDLAVAGSFVGPVPFEDVDLVYMPVPEPAALPLLCTGFFTLGLIRRPRSRA